MPEDNNASGQPISETVRKKSSGREQVRIPMVAVVGSGESLDSLRNPRFVSFGRVLEIGRRAAAADGQSALMISDRTVSSHHARITRVLSAAEEFTIEDLGSTNGTYVAGRR